MRMPGPAGQGHLAMVAFSAIVGGSFSLGSIIARMVEPAALNAIRFTLAATLIGAFAAATGGMRRSAFRHPWRYLLLGAMPAGFFILMFEGLKTAPPVSLGTVFTLTPMMSAGFGYVLLGQRTTRRMGLALAVAALGALWVIFRADLDALLAFEIGRGEILFVGGTTLHALYPVAIRKLHRGEDLATFTFGSIAMGTAILAAIGARDITITAWDTLPWIFWIVIAYLASFATAGTFHLVQFATLHLPSAKVMAYTYLTPSFIIAWEILRREPLPETIVLPGIALTIVALLILLKDEEAAGTTP